MPNVLLQNDVNNGFNGGSCSKKAYNFSNVGRLLTNRSIKTGTSLVNISQAIFEYLKRTLSATSAGGSVVISDTNSSIISALCKLVDSKWNMSYNVVVLFFLGGGEVINVVRHTYN